jgi:prepilin-type N-terminal cleavage/methylation domain-containing protein
MKRSPRGITLVELLVVVLIVCVLLAVLLPSIHTAREAARRSKCIGHTKQLALGLQEYADVFKTFPQDAVHGNQFDSADAWAAQGPLGQTWCVSILPFIEQRPLYDAINKKTGMGRQPYNGQEGGGVNAPAGYYGWLVEQVIPNFRCPSEEHASNPSRLAIPTTPTPLPVGAAPPSTYAFSFTNYAGAEGVYWGQLVPTEPATDAPQYRNNAPAEVKGIFAFSEPCPLGAIRDGLSNTLIMAEVTSCGAGQAVDRRGRFAGNITAETSAPVTPMVTQCVKQAGENDLYEIDWTGGNFGPMPPRYYRDNPAGYVIPEHPKFQTLASGSGRPRAVLFQSGGRLPAARVFRSLFCALATGATNGAPYCNANATFGFKYDGSARAGCSPTAWDAYNGNPSAPVYGYSPLFNGIYGPQSNWPGADSVHPGSVVVGYADGSARGVNVDIDLTVWQCLNTRAGGESITVDY